MKYSYQYEKVSGFITGEVFGNEPPKDLDLPSTTGQFVIDYQLPRGFKSYNKDTSEVTFLKANVDGDLIVDDAKQKVVV